MSQLDSNKQPPDTPPETAQQRFDRLYISSTEICRDMGVTRPTVMQARRRGLLPDPVSLGPSVTCYWERETVRPYLNAWKLILDVRRNRPEAQGA